MVNSIVEPRLRSYLSYESFEFAEEAGGLPDGHITEGKQKINLLARKAVYQVMYDCDSTRHELGTALTAADGLFLGGDGKFEAGVSEMVAELVRDFDLPGPMQCKSHWFEFYPLLLHLSEETLKLNVQVRYSTSSTLSLSL